MKQLLSIATCCALAILLTSCQSKPNTNATDAEIQTSPLPDMHTAENALSWAGTYEGTLPCADCEGVATTISLYEDKTYHIAKKYLRKEASILEEKGTFSWNEAGSTIQLSTDGSQYFVGENTLFHLDSEGNRITGELSEHYMLKKVNDALSASITDKYWKLVALDDEPIIAPADSKEIHFTLLSEENSIRGFAGCNGFGGGYTLGSNDQIAFSQLISTKMACPNLDTENKFMKALEATLSFRTEGNELWLFDTNENLLAQFEAVDP